MQRPVASTVDEDYFDLSTGASAEFATAHTKPYAERSRSDPRHSQIPIFLLWLVLEPIHKNPTYSLQAPYALTSVLGNVRDSSRDAKLSQQPHIGELSRPISDGKLQHVNASLSHTTLKRDAFEQTKDAYPQLSMYFAKLRSTRFDSVTVSFTGCLAPKLLASFPLYLLQTIPSKSQCKVFRSTKKITTITSLYQGLCSGHGSVHRRNKN